MPPEFVVVRRLWVPATFATVDVTGVLAPKNEAHPSVPLSKLYCATIWALAGTADSSARIPIERSELGRKNRPLEAFLK